MSTSATGYQRSKAAISVMLLQMKLGGQRPHLRLRDPDRFLIMRAASF